MRIEIDEAGNIIRATKNPTATWGIEIEAPINDIFAYKYQNGKLILKPSDEPTSPKPKIADVRQAKIADIKAVASDMLQATAWRLERATERDNLGSLRPEDETPAQVYAEREAIRRASNRAEDEINKLKKIADVESYLFEVKTTDYPAKPALTQLQFLRRFTLEERATIVAARTQNVALDDYMKLLELAKSVNMADPDVIMGVNLLEKLGIIGKGRAAEILEGTTL